MGEPTPNVNSNELGDQTRHIFKADMDAPEKSHRVYTELKAAVDERDYSEFGAKHLKKTSEAYADAKKLLASEVIDEESLPGIIEPAEVENALRVLGELEEMYQESYLERIQAKTDSETSRKASVGEAHELYQDQANKEAIQDAAVQDIGPENTSFGRSKKAEEETDTQTE